MTSESKYQAKIIKQKEAEGWYVIKLTQTNKNGIPDLICVKPNDVEFIEVKALKGRASPLQEYRIKELKALGFKASVMTSDK
jgi:Holliday junction resolvase